MNRKKIKQEIRHNRSVIKRKFDKTYKQLSLQLDNIAMTHIDDGVQSAKL